MISMEINLLLWSMAFLPIVGLLILMLRFQWGAAEAAPIGLLASLIVGLIFFKADLRLIASESAKGIWNAFTILIIIWPAILIYEVTNEANAFDAFRRGMQKFTPNELLQILAIGWIFVSFLQGITGFGVPIAVGAPLLVGIGVIPIWGVVIPLLGHAWAGTFGTLAVAWEGLLIQTGYTETLMANEIAVWASIFLWIINLVCGLAICWFYGKKEGLKKGLPAVIIISSIHGGGQMIISQINQTLSAFVMTCIALGVVFLLGKSKWYSQPWSIEDSRIIDRTVVRNNQIDYEETDMKMGEAFLPYFVLTGITIFALLPTPINKLLTSWKLGLPFVETSTGYGVVNTAIELYSPFTPLTHAGTFLLVAGLVGYYYYYSKGRISKGGGGRILVRIVKKTALSTIAIVGLIIMSRIMSGTGQTMVLATGTAKILNKAYVLVAPSVGLLGSFMTSSNMSSNILFGSFQQTTAQILGLNEAAILGAQTAGAAIGNSIAPGSIILGTTTAGILGQEGFILRKILPIALGIAVLCGIILLFTLIVI